jgi:site-specific recombinase XerC
MSSSARRLVATSFAAFSSSLQTSIRGNELAALDLEGVNLEKQYLILMPTGKPSNKMVFSDDKAARALTRWIKASEQWLREKGEEALFRNNHGQRLSNAGTNTLVHEAAMRIGLHDHGCR